MGVVAGVVGAVSGVAGAITGRKQAKIGQQQADISAQQVQLQREQLELQKTQVLEERNRARQEASDQEVRRTEVLREQEKERRLSRARADLLEAQQIRQRINEARVLQAEQLAAGAEAGFAGAAGQIASDVGAAIGASRTEGAFGIALQQSQRRQQDILNRLVPVESLPGFQQVRRDVLFSGGQFVSEFEELGRGNIGGGIEPGRAFGSAPIPSASRGGFLRRSSGGGR